MSISVVIPALNEAGNIGRLVEETYAAIPPERLVEVIVVDDHSEDATGDEIKAHGAMAGVVGVDKCLHTDRLSRCVPTGTAIAVLSFDWPWI